MARLYGNESFPFPTVQMLRQIGHEVQTVRESGAAGIGAPDEDVLAFATSQRRAVLTLNRRHFIRLHTQRPDHAGIIVCTFDPDFEAPAARIDAAIAASDDLAGRLIRVKRSGQ